MIEAQVISKLLEDKNIELFLEQNINSSFFVTYSEEARFIFDHYSNYHKIPTKETFLSKFPEFELTNTDEDWDYLTTGLRENYMFNQLATTLTNTSKLIEQNALSGYQVLRDKILELENIKPSKSIDLIKQADDRLKEFNDKASSSDHNVIKIGLPEMDERLFGWNMGEELVTIIARTNQGKSWLLLEFLMNAWKQGKNVGLYSGEMSANQIGYRFDALYKHFSNLALMRGKEDQQAAYSKYIENLKNMKNCFVVITPKDLGHLADVNDIEYLIKKYDLDIVGIDQFSLMEDFRSKKGDPLRIRLGNISSDLFNLSMKYKIPILALSQANRSVMRGTTPELEHISESDAIAQNSTKVLSISRNEQELRLSVVKNRYGKVGDEFVYLWDIDKGEFKFSKYGNEQVDDNAINNSRKIEESPF